MPTEEDHIARIVERLRRDHPDPALRMQLYDDGGLPAYVELLLDSDDPGIKERVIAGVRAAEDGSVGPMTSND